MLPIRPKQELRGCEHARSVQVHAHGKGDSRGHECGEKTAGNRETSLVVDDDVVGVVVVVAVAFLLKALPFASPWPQDGINGIN